MPFNKVVLWIMAKKQSKKRRRMRCPYCRSLTTKKNGKRSITSVGIDRKTEKFVQRYQCKSCKRTFSLRQDKHKHYSSGFKQEIVRMHIEERMSFRVISKRIEERYAIKASYSYLNTLFNDTIKNVKSSAQIHHECSPNWEGYLVVDEKVIRVKGEKKLGLIAKDKSGDIVHEELLRYDEQVEYNNFFRFMLNVLNYPIQAVTTDLDPMLEKSIKTVLPEIPHQKCLKHAMDKIYKLIDYRGKMRRLDKYDEKIKKGRESLSPKEREEYSELKIKLKEIEEIIGIIKQSMWSKHSKKANGLFKKLSDNYGEKYPVVIKFLLKHKKGLFTHQKDKDIPKTNNDAENTNRQIKRRLKTIEAFQNYENAYNYLIMLCNYLRMKPYTDCKRERKYRNGKSPLELCHSKIIIKDWLKYSLNFS